MQHLFASGIVVHVRQFLPVLAVAVIPAQSFSHVRIMPENQLISAPRTRYLL